MVPDLVPVANLLIPGARSRHAVTLRVRAVGGSGRLIADIVGKGTGASPAEALADAARRAARAIEALDR